MIVFFFQIPPYLQVLHNVTFFQHSKKLSVYSATFNVDFKNYKKLYLNDTQSLVIPTVWSKLVYDEERKSATAILLHNTPDNEFKSNRLCAPGEQITCNFINWLDSSALKNTIDKKTITETAQYAYCCQVRKKSNIMTEYYGIYAVKAEADIVDIDYPKRTQEQETRKLITLSLQI